MRRAAVGSWLPAAGLLVAAVVIAGTLATAASAATLWQSISTNGSYSVLSSCVRLADDPAVYAALNGSAPGGKCTLFAPLDAAFEGLGPEELPCQDGSGNATEAAALVKYLVSSDATALPYLNQPFPTLLGAASDLYVYSISKDAATPPELAPILYVNDARALSWEAVDAEASQFLVCLDRVLTRPPGPNGTLWDVLVAHPNLTTTVALIDRSLPEFRAKLQAPADVAMKKGYHTFFAPDDSAWAQVSADRMARLQDDPQALQTLLSFHTLSNLAGDYPRSTTGMYYSQQFFPAASFKARDIYAQFYPALEGFDGLRLPNDLGILLDLSRANGTLRLQGNASAVVGPDLSAYNGVVHRLDAVLPLPDAIPAVLASPPPLLAAAGTFSVLSQLVGAAGAFASQLATGGPYTMLAPTDAAFQSAVQAGRLPPVAALVRDTDRVASLLRYWAVDSAQQLYLFKPDPYADPFKDDFPDGVRLADGTGRPLFVHRQHLGTTSGGGGGGSGGFNDTAVFINGARLYQCAEGEGWGHACGARPTPSNVYAINDDRIINMVHAVDAVPLPPEGTLLQALEADPDLSSFAALLARTPDAADLVAALNATDDDSLLTVFAPTNDALAALLEARPWLVVDRDPTDGAPIVAAELLRYHVAPGLWYARWLGQEQQLPTAAFDGDAVLLVNASAAAGAAPPGLRVNRLDTAGTDVPATNGVLHKLTGVLVPDLLQIAYASAGLGRTVAVIEEVGGASMVETLNGPGPFTLLGPVDAAYGGAAAAVTREQLRYHVGARPLWPENVTAGADAASVLPSLLGLPLYLARLPQTVAHAYAPSASGLFANHGELRLPVHRAINGLVYAVDALLAPPQQGLMDMLTADAQTRTFAGLLARAGLDALLADETAQAGAPWTVFAPSTSVLEGIFRGEEIWADERQLPELLKFHLVRGRRLFTPAFADTACAPSAEGFCAGPPDTMSLQGQALATQVVSRNRTFLSSADACFTAPFLRPNLHARNGVIHVVDGVLTYAGFQRPA